MVTRRSYPESSGLLGRLAALHGLLPEYRDSRGRLQASSAESIGRVLEVMGAGLGPGELGSETAISEAIRRREAALRQQLVEPVFVAWDGRLPRVAPPASWEGSARLRLMLEDASVEEWRSEPGDATMFTSLARRLRGARLPSGYHNLEVRVGERAAHATVISAPRRCSGLAAGEEPDGGRSADAAALRAAGRNAAEGGTAEVTLRVSGDEGSTAPVGASGQVVGEIGPILSGNPWGVFAPVYSLRSDRDLGAGDLADLQALATWTAARGGCMVSTLPLLATFLEDPFDPTPYRPVSRLFWNELYLVPEWTFEWERCPEVRRHLQESGVRARVHELRAAPLVDHRGVMALKREVFEMLASCFFSGGDAGRGSFDRFLRDRPEVEAYAAFRAGLEGRGAASGRTRPAPVDPRRYHLYCQWQMEEQLSRLSADPRVGLALDLPLGVHPEGFDVHSRPDLFVEGVSVGAPPDAFFTLGQDWDFAPLHPEKAREAGHAYLAACLRAHMRHARLLRIDHVMSLHRLYWIPSGAAATDGVYVSYPWDELYAVICLESSRTGCAVAGEDLGTVPAGVRPAMKRHGLLRTWAAQGAFRPNSHEVLPSPPADAVVSLNTHDMVPFAGFLKGADIATRVGTGQLDAEGAQREKAARGRLVRRLGEYLGVEAGDHPGLLIGMLRRLAHSRAALILVGLNDIFGETRPQNVPGTGIESPNWRGKSAAEFLTRQEPGAR